MLFQNLVFILPSSTVLAKKNVVSFTSDFYRKRGCATMHNYAGTCKGICSYNLVFVVNFSNAFVMGTRHFRKVVLRMKLFLSL